MKVKLMNERSPITEGLEVLIQYFEEHKIPYVVVGGIAVLTYGRSRFTNNIDVIVDHNQIDREHFMNYLKARGFDATLEDLGRFDLKENCTVFFSSYRFRVDLKGKYGENEEYTLETAVTAKFNGIKLKVANPIATIIFKLVFGSEQDYEDALAVYVRNKEKLNMRQLEEEAKKRGVLEKLKGLINEVEEVLKNDKRLKK